MSRKLEWPYVAPGERMATKPPEWFKAALMHAQALDHADRVKSFPWIGRLIHRMRPCPACRYVREFHTARTD